MPPDIQAMTIKWSLYRSLLKLAPSHPVHRYIQHHFRLNRHLSSPRRLQPLLQDAHSMLDELKRLPTSPSLQSKYSQLSSYLSTTQPSPSPSPSSSNSPRPPPQRQRRPRRPLLTPNLVHSTPYHTPFPRLIPQPLHLSMMIFNRRLASQKTWDRHAALLTEKASLLLLPQVKKDPKAKKRLQEVRGLIRGLMDELSVEKKRAMTRISVELRAKAIEANKRREVVRAKVAKGKKRRAVTVEHSSAKVPPPELQEVVAP